MDEMKTQENLAWDKHNGELIGYVDLGDIDLNYATLSKVTTVASHVLVFLIRNIVNPFKFSLTKLATDGISASQMFPLLWKAISICVKNSLKVIAVTCGGASPNRKLFRMHWHLTQGDDMNPETDVTYRTRNLFIYRRFFYFFSDVPHLLKPHKTVYQILAVVNLHATCGMALCFYYGTILLTYFMKIKNVDFIYFQHYA